MLPGRPSIFTDAANDVAATARCVVPLGTRTVYALTAASKAGQSVAEAFLNPDARLEVHAGVAVLLEGELRVDLREREARSRSAMVSENAPPSKRRDAPRRPSEDERERRGGARARRVPLVLAAISSETKGGGGTAFRSDANTRRATGGPRIIRRAESTSVLIRRVD